MSIRLNSVKCPECGADLQIEDGRKQLFCSYCGTKIIVTNENEHIYRHIDEAGMKQAETDRMVRMRELELAENSSINRKTLTKIWLAATGALGILSIILLIIPNEDLKLTGMLLLEVTICLGIAGGTLIFKTLPEKENEKILMKSGGIRFPKSLEPFSEQYVNTVEHTLRSAGFRNITTINMHDITVGLFQKPGKVENISVNGENITSGGKVYLPNALIAITYHGR